MRVLLLGAGGMLARELVREAPAVVELLAKTHSEVDITEAAAVADAMSGAAPDLIINAAAYNAVDGAETERARAFLVNGEGPGIVGRAAANTAQRTVHRAPGTPLVVHYSTDYVFDGTGRQPYREDHATAPLGAYAASKLAGERSLGESGARYLIIRTQWLFGVHGRSFPRTMWERATAGQRSRVVNDQVGRPTYTVDLARATWGLIAAGPHDGMTAERHDGMTELGGGSIVHIANTGTATWYDVAKRVYEAAGAAELLEPCATADYPTAARRPTWSVLDTTRHERLVGAPLSSWEDAIDRFLREVRSERTVRARSR